MLKPPVIPCCNGRMLINVSAGCYLSITSLLFLFGGPVRTTMNSSHRPLELQKPGSKKMETLSGSDVANVGSMARDLESHSDVNWTIGDFEKNEEICYERRLILESFSKESVGCGATNESGIYHGGLERLNQLLRAMEQLNKLKQTNKILTKKCLYLEDTRMLFKISNQILLEDNERDSLYKKRSDGRQRRPEEASRDHTSQTSTTNSDLQASPSRSTIPVKQRRQNLGKLLQRSQSEGSIPDVSGGSNSKSGMHNISEQFQEHASLSLMEDKRSIVFSKKWQQMKNAFSSKKGDKRAINSGDPSVPNTTKKHRRTGDCTLPDASLWDTSDVIGLKKDFSEPLKLKSHEPRSLKTLPRRSVSRKQLLESSVLLKPPGSNLEQVPRRASYDVPPSEPADTYKDSDSFTPWVKRTASRRQSSPIVSVNRPIVSTWQV